MNPESKNLDDYLVSDMIVDWKTPDVRQAALDLTLSIPDEVEKACCLYEWVQGFQTIRANLHHILQLDI
jgi:hypothetical protein